MQVNMTQHCLTSSSKYLLSTMLLLLTESTLFFLKLALASRTTSSPGSSSVVNWAIHVANARKHGVTEQASTTSQSGSRLAPHHHIAYSRTTSAATSVSNYSQPVQPSMNTAVDTAVQDNKVFGDAVNEADERAMMVASFKNHMKNTLASNFYFT